MITFAAGYALFSLCVYGIAVALDSRCAFEMRD